MLILRAVELRATIRGTSYRFSSVREVLAKANPPKSGDNLAGIAAEDAVERVAARAVLSQLSLRDLRENPVIPYEQDALTFEIPLVADGDGTQIVEDVLSGNLVLADHGLSLPGPPAFLNTNAPDTVEYVSLPDVTMDVPYRPNLPFASVTFATPYEPALAAQRSATQATEQDPRNALAAVTLTNLEALLITMLSPAWRANVTSVYHVLRDRRSGPTKDHD